MERSSSPSSSGVAARRAAVTLLEAVLGRRRTLDEALGAMPEMAARDRGFAHLIAATVLRRLGTLDAVLEPFLRRAPPDAVLHALRTGAAQLLFLGTQPHAAVGETVAAVRTLPKGDSFAGLANAVLRRVAAEGQGTLAGLDGPRLDTPDWLWRSWHAAYGPATARAIAVAHQREAPLDLTLKPGEDGSAWAARLGATLLPTGSLRLPADHAPVRELDGFAEGAWWVQDAAAALPARLLAAKPGERVADLCAAPGGKTAQLAAAGASVTAVERAPDRAGRIGENLARLALAAEIVVADAATWTPSEAFDAVLLDAPCTATGTIRRHPDIARVKRERDVAALAPAQDGLLAAAARMLKQGGRLVYAVCSLEPAEGEGAVARALAAGLPLRPEPFTEAEIAAVAEARTAEGHLRTTPALWPERGGMDGFFAARLVRVAS
ncbi:RsmB/NOP family class I SAM-dependent RNA methyltransferase [Elioraea rosea]|uniref:RsmB/NOP family class I SAM-dependent RNA methyltransferase n=1 Tax=Elioraea rosea TaxID=2492390 RepID=UPI001183CBE3|nr:transcription antitermination factor NusB [Elioraea rosea]